jgi:hypothetical protein
MNKELINYVNWKEICEDNNLKYGDISLDQTLQVEELIKQFIKQNK